MTKYVHQANISLVIVRNGSQSRKEIEKFGLFLNARPLLNSLRRRLPAEVGLGCAFVLEGRDLVRIDPDHQVAYVTLYLGEP